MADIPIRCFAVSVVAVRTVECENQVLLLRRNHTLVGEWCQVAGGIEDGETAWEAALRELAEETGLTCDRLYSADICEQFYEPDRDCISILPVFVAFVSASAKVVINDEHSEFLWASFDAACGMVPFAGQRKVLRHVEEEFVVRAPIPHLLIDTQVSPLVDSSGAG